MPKIVSTLPAPAAPNTRAAAANPSPLVSSRSASRREGTPGAFDQILSGARKREPVPPAETKESKAEPSAKVKPAKEKSRAERREPAAKPGKAEPRKDAPEAETVDPESHDEHVDENATPADESEAKPVEGKKPRKGDGAPASEAAEDDSDASPSAEVSAPVLKWATEPVAGDVTGDVLTQSVEAELAEGAESLEDGPARPAAAGSPGAAAVAVVAWDAADALQQAQQSTPQDASVGLTAVDVEAATSGEASALPAELSGAKAAPAAGTNPAHSVPQNDTNAAGSEADAPSAGLGAASEQKAPADPLLASSNGALSIEALEPETEAAVAPAAPAPVHGAAAADVAAAAARGIEGLFDTQPKPAAQATATPSQPLTHSGDVAPEVRFADDNHGNIVAGVRGQLMPSGGTMHIRLDPPELGPLAVTVRMKNGVMEASFETSNDEAAKLLSHSLSSLKSSLESQGVSVERLHVQQAPKSETPDQSGGGGGDNRDGGQQQHRDPEQEHHARQEQQRKEMLRRMWAKLRGVEDPLDMVA